MITALAYLTMIRTSPLGLSPDVPTLNVRVDGEGYLRLAKDGRCFYATAATVGVQEGHLAAKNGLAFSPRIAVPVDTQRLEIDLQGNVTAVGGANRTRVGSLVVATFSGRADLISVGDYYSTSAHPALYSPGDGPAGVIRTSASKAFGMPVKATIAHHANARPEVLVSPKVEIDKPTVSLGDISEITGSEHDRAKLGAIDLGYAPPVSSSREFNRALILAKIRAAGFLGDAVDLSVPVGAQVVRKGQSFTSEQLVEAALQQAQKKFGDDLGFTSETPVRAGTAPTGELTFSCRFGEMLGDSVTAQVYIMVNGVKVDSRTVSLKTSTQPIEVRPQDHIRIRLMKAGVSVEVFGHLRQTGMVGRNVNVITDDGADLTGKLTTASMVEVKL